MTPSLYSTFSITFSCLPHSFMAGHLLDLTYLSKVPVDRQIGQVGPFKPLSFPRLMRFGTLTGRMMWRRLLYLKIPINQPMYSFSMYLFLIWESIIYPEPPRGQLETLSRQYCFWLLYCQLCVSKISRTNAKIRNSSTENEHFKC